ncbi:MAG: AtpZ/AtpI family protein [Rhodospirillales bacterium]|nr:AtpZ/AtpI family protein [Rhodospirillales bacterium]
MSRHAPEDRPGEDFEARLKRLKAENAPRSGPAASGATPGYGMAFTIATDLVGGVLGGALVGWFLDRWLGTAPGALISLFFLGAAAGMWNVYRTVRGYDAALGFRHGRSAPSARGNETQRPAGARPENEGGDRGGQSSPSIRGAYDRSDSDRRD